MWNVARIGVNVFPFAHGQKCLSLSLFAVGLHSCVWLETGAHGGFRFWIMCSVSAVHNLGSEVAVIHLPSKNTPGDTTGKCQTESQPIILQKQKQILCMTGEMHS